MPDFALTARPALGNQSAAITIGAHSVVECDLAIASVAAFHHGDCAGRLAAFLGAPLPGPGKQVQSAGVSCFWTGEGQWMLTAPHETHEDLFAQLARALTGACAVTEQTGGWVGFDVTGPDLPTAFERLVGFDIHSMQQGDAERSTIEHIGAFVLCPAPGDSLRVFALRSFARSLHHAIRACLTTTTALSATANEPERHA